MGLNPGAQQQHLNTAAMQISGHGLIFAAEFVLATVFLRRARRTAEIDPHGVAAGAAAATFDEVSAGYLDMFICQR
jgi:hypothetical protein